MKKNEIKKALNFRETLLIYGLSSKFTSSLDPLWNVLPFLNLGHDNLVNYVIKASQAKIEYFKRLLSNEDLIV